jgi:hypothetical protein
MNRTELRHKMLTLASETGVVYKHCFDLRGKVWRFRVAIDQPLSAAAPRALGELVGQGFLREVLNVRLLAPRRIDVTLKGLAVLAEWNEKYGEVQP